MLLSALFGLCALGLSGQKDDRTLRPQQGPTLPVAAEARIALVIGNGAYSEAPLRNPVNDAQAMKVALEGCRFTVRLLQNAGKREMEDAIRVFGDRIRGGAVGLFYFAGHGVQVKGVNYLVPVGAKLDREDEVPYQAVEAGLVLDKMEAAKNKLNILILDACRNNPFARSWRSTGDRGLAQVKAPTGSLIAYATAPGSTAADGIGEHGLYTEALLTQLKEPGLELEKVFKKVREKVLEGSGLRQTPWESNSTVGDFFFRPLATNLTGPTEAELEATYWEGIQNSRDPKEFDTYLARFPGGAHAELARLKLKALRTAVPVVVSNPAEPWKALQRDKLETKDEWAARVAALGPLKVGTASIEKDRYDVDQQRLSVPLRVDPWATAFVGAGPIDLDLDRTQMARLAAGFSTSFPMAVPFEIREGRPCPRGSLVISTAIGDLRPQPGPKPHPASVRNAYDAWEVTARAGEATFSLVQIPAGAGTQGSDAPYYGNDGVEFARPEHLVTLSKAYWMGKVPVTQGQWRVVMGNNPSNFKEAGPEAPVESVSWDDVQQFLLKLNGLPGDWEYRLPTEAEWEYACRAGHKADAYGPLEAIAWYDANSGATTHPVGQKLPNAFGLFDMLGNVWQWCQDHYEHYRKEPVKDPQGPPTGETRIFRGGGWNNPPEFVRTWARPATGPNTRLWNIGFRVVATPRTP
jgi:formylglycine-generating enzyme required for sulfatase activity